MPPVVVSNRTFDSLNSFSAHSLLACIVSRVENKIFPTINRDMKPFMHELRRLDKPRDSLYGLYAKNVGQSAAPLNQGTRDITQAQSSDLCDPVVAARWRCYVASLGKYCSVRWHKAPALQ